MTTARSSPPDDQPAPLARLVELALVVPVEVGARLVEAVPIVVDKVPSAAERVRREIVLARFLGKLAVDQGVRELRQRLSTDTGGDTTSVEAEASATAPVSHPTVPVVDSDDDGSDTANADTPDAESLALADYDHLSSAQIVAKLDGLDPTELGAIERYERAGRHRRTILGKLDQLRTTDEDS
jgi:hypothetical protein